MRALAAGRFSGVDKRSIVLTNSWHRDTGWYLCWDLKQSLMEDLVGGLGMVYGISVLIMLMMNMVIVLSKWWNR